MQQPNRKRGDATYSNGGSHNKRIRVDNNCTECQQPLANILTYKKHPVNSQTESITLTHGGLATQPDKKKDGKPSYKLAAFTVYDIFGHLCPFDTGVIRSGKSLMVSGYIKSITDDDPSTCNGLPTFSIGPLTKWFSEGFDEDKNSVIGFSSEKANYYLLQPSLQYEPVMASIIEKNYVAKVVLEYLLDRVWDRPCYEDILQFLDLNNDLRITKSVFLQCIEFICHQIICFDTANRNENDCLMDTPCMRILARRAEYYLSDAQLRDPHTDRVAQIRNEVVSTTLVQAIFVGNSKDQTKNNTNNQGCGICDFCEAPDCGTCPQCMKFRSSGGAGSSKDQCSMRKCRNVSRIGNGDDTESNSGGGSSTNEIRIDCGKCPPCLKLQAFDGAGSSKQECIMHKYPNMSRSGNELDTNTNGSFSKESGMDKSIQPPGCKTSHNLGTHNVAGSSEIPKFILFKCKLCLKKKNNGQEGLKNQIRVVQWTSKVTNLGHDRTYYNKARVGKMEVQISDCVMLNSNEENSPPCIARIVYMWEENNQKMFHARLFCRSKDTILGAAASPRELFVVNVCEDHLLTCIVSKAKVVKRSSKCGKKKLEAKLQENQVDYFFSHCYSLTSRRFERFAEEASALPAPSCISCRNRQTEAALKIPMIHGQSVSWMGEEYTIGSGVFLEPHTVVPRRNPSHYQLTNPYCQDINKEKYPEYYRHFTGYSAYSNVEPPPDPFDIGIITYIRVVANRDIKITVRTFYRPEDTVLGLNGHVKDLNCVYWSEDISTVSFKKVQGKCYLEYYEYTKHAREWSKKGPHRFYFQQTYNKTTKGFSLLQGVPDNPVRIEPTWAIPAKPLACMDIFAGCGGLSEGLRASGVAEIKWAIEQQPAAAQAFQLNHPDAVVYNADSNELLKYIMEGKIFDGKTLPNKGEVEMIVGGFPCQNSTLVDNSFPISDPYYLNELLMSFLTYCSYYSPKYIIMENMPNFDNYGQSKLFRNTIECLLTFGYQVTFGRLQAGNYGVPQERKRLVLMAAAPEYILPKLPDPQNTCIKASSGCLHIDLEDKKYNSGKNVITSKDQKKELNNILGVRWSTSAPYRNLTVRDAISDVPDAVAQGDGPVAYKSVPTSPFQRELRQVNNNNLIDHITIPISPLVEARIAHIPTLAGSDWRNLPNIQVRLSDGSRTSLLEYESWTRQGSRTLHFGVCICCVGRNCTLGLAQANTLIPWNLVHTANKCSNWVGVYGRVEWNGVFNTIVTRPEPLTVHGKVLHPDRSRVLTVRECARAQGFPDKYILFGSIEDKYRQVGNAMPPPLALALGREVLTALARSASH